MRSSRSKDASVQSAAHESTNEAELPQPIPMTVPRLPPASLLVTEAMQPMGCRLNLGDQSDAVASTEASDAPAGESDQQVGLHGHRCRTNRSVAEISTTPVELAEFQRQVWPFVESKPLSSGLTRHIDRHLRAWLLYRATGEIKKLPTNIPPGTSKSLAINLRILSGAAWHGHDPQSCGLHIQLG